jgi:hypothetical protein
MPLKTPLEKYSLYLLQAQNLLTSLYKRIVSITECGSVLFSRIQSYGYNGVYSVEFQSTFRRNIWPPSSGSKNMSLARNQHESRWKAMEAIYSSETSVYTQRTTRRFIPEDHTLHNHRCENLKSSFTLFLSDSVSQGAFCALILGMFCLIWQLKQFHYALWIKREKIKKNSLPLLSPPCVLGDKILGNIFLSTSCRILKV